MQSYRHSFIKLTNRIVSHMKHSGPTFTVQYLKEAHRLTMKAVAGERASSTDEPRVATRRGLPLIIPGVLRVLIEDRNPVVIRGVLTLLSIYRVMRSRPKMKLSSITGDFVGMSKTLLDREVEDGLARLPSIKSSSGDQDR